MPTAEAAAALSQQQAPSSDEAERAKNFVQEHFGAVLAWVKRRETYVMSTRRSSASSLRYLSYELCNARHTHTAIAQNRTSRILGVAGTSRQAWMASLRKGRGPSAAWARRFR